MAFPAPFEDFVAPARRRPQIWRLIAGCVILGLVYALWVAATALAAVVATGPETAMTALAGMIEARTPAATLLLLTTFAGMLLGAAVATRVMHGRRAGTLFGPTGRLLRHFAVAVLTVAVVYGASVLIWSSGFEARPNLPPTTWAMLLPMALPMILIQTGAEEVVFRGYLMQQIAARIPWQLAYLVVPSVIFGALHYDPTTSGENALVVAVGATLFGLIAADLTRATGSLGAGWGLHFANNAVAILGISTQGTITGLALYVTPYTADDPALSGGVMLADAATLLLVWAVLRWRLRVRG